MGGKIMKKILTSILAVAMAAGLAACQGSASGTGTTAAVTDAQAADDAGKTGSEMTWKLATDAARDYPTTKALIRFADEMYERSG